MKDNILKGIFILGMFIVLTVQSMFEGKQPAESEQIKIEHNLLDDDSNDDKSTNTKRDREIRTFRYIRH